MEMFKVHRITEKRNPLTFHWCYGSTQAIIPTRGIIIAGNIPLANKGTYIKFHFFFFFKLATISDTNENAT